MLPADEKSLRLLADFSLSTHFPTQKSRSVIDHVYVRTDVVNSNNVMSDVVNVYFSDDDALTIIF